MSEHVPCCQLSVECGRCGAAIGESCAVGCNDPGGCACNRLPRPCCDAHYAEVPA